MPKRSPLGTLQFYEALTGPLNEHHRRALDSMLAMQDGSNVSDLAWLRQPPGPPNAKHVLAHLARLETIRDIGLPDGLERAELLGWHLFHLTSA